MTLVVRAFLPCIVLVAVAGCSAAEGSDTPASAPAPGVTPSVVVPRTVPARKAATSCARSTEPLAPAADTDGVELTLSTDPSRTSLLLKNTGGLTVVVLPDADFGSRLIAAPAADPKDAASRAALVAVNAGGGELPGVPAYVPRTQVIRVPPQWAICALSDDVKEIASVRYLQDQASSAEYFVAKALADQLLLRNSAARSRATLVSCARGTLNTLKANPTLQDIELYVAAVGPGSACRARYKALLHGDERGAGQLGATVLNELGNAPRLLPDSALLGTTASP